MNITHRFVCLALVAACLGVSGCKKKGAVTEPVTVDQSQIDAARDAATRDMQKVAVSGLKKSHMGKKCVVTAYTMEDKSQLGPPPPPFGMVRLLGDTTLYQGELVDIAPGTLTIQAPYPTAGRVKEIEIDKEDIQSVHLAR